MSGRRSILFLTLFVLAFGLFSIFTAQTSLASQPEARLRRTPRPTRTPRVTPTAVPTQAPTPTPVSGGGSPWLVVDSPNAGGRNNQLNAITAIAADDVWAVGESFNASGSSRQTLIQHWNGSQWQIVSSPNPDPSINRLLGVGAATSNDVWAVGRQAGATGPNWKALILHYDGASWAVSPAPDTGAQSTGELRAVAALAPDDVWAVGASSSPETGWWDQPLIVHWDGSSWSIVPSPQVGTSAYLNGIAAVSANDIWAVGYYRSGNINTLVMHWDGSSWSVVPSPGGTASQLTAVAAVSSQDVWAVGSRSSGSATLTLHWDGAAWTEVPSPNGAYTGVNRNVLSALAVVAPDEIWAVGTSAFSSLCGFSDAPLYRSYTLALRWNGALWEQSSTANPSTGGGCLGLRNDFYGVAGSGGTTFAVGSFYDGDLSVQLFKTLVELAP